MTARLKTSWLGLSALLGLTLAGAALVEKPAPVPTARALPELIPAGPLLVLQATDFSSLVHDWNGSPEKHRWLESSNYATFVRSRLYLRLVQAQDEFAAAAGLPPDMSLLESVAGGDSALALYDIGNLEFLYLTRLPSARAAESALWRGRGNYEPRESAGVRYFVHVDKSSHRVVAFALADQLLLLATREDLLAGALALLARQRQVAVKDEPWFADAVQVADQNSSARTPDLRLVLNLVSAIRSPYFRSYWIQQNVSDLGGYRAVVSDLYRSPVEVREMRALLRSGQNLATGGTPGGALTGTTGQPAQSAASAPGNALGELLSLIPPEAGFYRAWAAPGAVDALTLLEDKVLSPSAGPSAASTLAPAVDLTNGEVGSETDLETRIDQAPLPRAESRFAPEPLRELLCASNLEAMLEIESSAPLPDGVLIRTPAVIALLAGSDWDGDAVRRGLTAAVEGLWTTSSLGVGWVARRSGSDAYYDLDGLARLSVATRGRLLVVATSAAQLSAVLDRISKSPSESSAASGLVYTARFNHARESANFARMTRLIDTPNVESTPALRAAGDREPQFFSENIASLSHTLSRVESESIMVGEHGTFVSVDVAYQLKK